MVGYEYDCWLKLLQQSLIYFSEYTTYQLRAYLYQARNLYGADHTGLSGQYVYLIGTMCGRLWSEVHVIWQMWPAMRK